MLLRLRCVFVCNLKCENVLSSVTRVSPYRFNKRLLSNFKFSQASYCRISRISGNLCIQQRYQSTSEDSKQKESKATSTSTPSGGALSQRARLKQAVRDYGSTIIVFHVAISLVSLGVCYVAISSGVDAVNLLSRLNFPDYVVSSKAAVGGSTFVMAYAVHKALAPVRIFLTLSCAPLIVRYLRKINLIKPPK